MQLVFSFEDPRIGAGSSEILWTPGAALHEVASRQFWGLSKILNGQQETIALLLGQSVCPFPDKPVQRLVSALTYTVDAPILFIENAATFESLAASESHAPEEAKKSGQSDPGHCQKENYVTSYLVLMFNPYLHPAKKKGL